MTTYTVYLMTSGLTLDNGDELVTLLGGSAYSTTVNSGGFETVSGGGVEFTNTINDGGSAAAALGGTLDNTVLNSGGTESVDSGGTADNTQVRSGGFEVVSSGGQAQNTTIGGGGVLLVLPGGTAGGVLVSAGGTFLPLPESMIGQVGGSLGEVALYNSGTGLSGLTYLGRDAAGTVVGPGLIEYVAESGGIAVNNVVSGGAQFVYYGGSASDTLVSGGGSQSVFYDGTATDTIVGDGGREFVYSSGRTTGTIVNSGGQEVVGAAVVDTTVNDGGDEYVEAHAQASGTTIGDGGNEYVFTGGAATNATVDAGGSQIVSGGQTVSTTVNSGGSVYLYGGAAVYHNDEDYAVHGTANDTTINSGGFALVSGGVAVGTTIDAGGTEVVVSGITVDIAAYSGFVDVGSTINILGTTSDTTVNDGGTEALYYGAVASSATINSGGAEVVFSGGSAIDTTVSSGGALIVLPGGTQSGTTGSVNGAPEVILYQPNAAATAFGARVTGLVVNAGWTEDAMFGGVSVSATVNDGGNEALFSAGVASATDVEFGGTEAVSAGGTANFTTVNSDGFQYVSSGGTAIGTVIDSGGEAYVQLGGAITGAMVNFSGQLHITDSGAATGTTVNSGGYDIVSVGGTARHTTVNGGGYEVVSAGGVALDTLVNGSGFQVVSSGGVASVTSVAGGQQDIASGGSAVFAFVSGGGFQIISSGGSAALTILSGGTQQISSGGTANSVAVHSGTQDVAGVAIGTDVDGGGFQDIYAGGVASATIVTNDGNEYVYFGGSASGTRVDSGGAVRVSAGGVTSDTVVFGGGEEHVSDDGQTVSSTIAGGFEFISSGGTTTASTISSGGAAYVNGTAISTTVDDSGSENIGLGGVATNTTVDNGGDAYVLFGGQAISATVNAGGTLYVSNGGVAEAVTVNAGGLETLGFGADASATDLIDGGVELVSSGGSGIGTTIGSGALEAVFSGGIASNVAVGPGGTLLVFSGGTVNGSAGGTTGSGVYLYSAAGPVFSSLGDNAGPLTLSGSAVEFVLTSGTEVSATVSGGGQQIVIDGTASDTIVNSGGTLAVSSGGSAVSATVNSRGDIVVVDGTASATVVNNGGSLTVSFDGNAVSTTIGVGGSLLVTAGGTATHAAIGGSAHVGTGGVLSSATVTGYESVSGGLAMSNTITSGGYQVVTAGGTASGTIVEPGGEEVVSSGGVARNTVVEPGGTIIVAGGQDPGVTFSNVLPLNGGTVMAGAPSIPQLNGITVEGPGTLLDRSTLTVDNETLIDGATLTVNGGAFASLDGGRLYGGSGAVTIDPTGTFALLAASAFQTGGSVTITNNGLFEAETGNSNIDADFINASSVTIAAGSLTMADSYSDAGGGGVTLAAGTEIVFNQANDYTGEVTGPGTVDFAGGGTIGPTFVLTTPTIITANTLAFSENQVFTAVNGVSDNLDTAYRAEWILNGHTVTFGPSLTSTFGVPSGNGLNIQSGGGGGEIINEGSIALDGDTFGGVTLLDEGLATVNGGGVFGGGTITVAASATIDLLSASSFQAGASQQIVNDGLFEETTGNSNVGATFSNNGGVLVLAGALSFQNGFTGGGFVSIAAGAEVAFDQSANYIGVMSGSGTADFQGGGTFASLFSLTVPTIDMGGTITFGANQTFNAQNGTADYLDTFYRAEWILNGNTVTFGPSLTSTFGVPSGNGLNIQSGGGGGEIINEGSIALDGDTFGGVTLLDEGLATVNGGGVFGGGTITVAASATIDLLSASSFQAGASQQIVNDGLFEETTGNSNVGATFSNNGGVLVLAGALSFQNGFTGGGFVSIAAGAEVAFNQANIYGQGTITGAGSVVFAGGTLGAGLQLAVSNVVLDGGDSLYFGENIALNGSLTTNYRSGFVLNGNTVTFGSLLVASASGLYMDGAGEVINQTSLAIDGDTLDGGMTLDDRGTETAVNDSIYAGSSGTLAVESAGTLNLSAVGVATGLVTTNAGLVEQISGTGDTTFNGSVTNTGTILAGTGTLTLAQGASGAGGSATIDAGATLQLGGAFAQSLTMLSSGSADGATLFLDAAGDFSGTISGLGYGDRFVFRNASVNSGTIAGTTLQAVVNNTTYDYTLATAAAGETAVVSGSTLTIECFAAGTRIMTVHGPVPVETLAVGDRVILADGGCEMVIWVGSRMVDCSRHPKPEQVWPVRVRAGAFGENCPARDLFLSPDHAVFVNGVLVPVKLLVDGTHVVQVKCDRVRYFHVELPRHAIILAEELAVESYLDAGDRMNLRRDGETIRLLSDFAARLVSDTAVAWETRGAAPLVVAGEALARAQHLVAAHASRQVCHSEQQRSLTKSPSRWAG